MRAGGTLLSHSWNYSHATYRKRTSGHHVRAPTPCANAGNTSARKARSRSRQHVAISLVNDPGPRQGGPQATPWKFPGCATMRVTVLECLGGVAVAVAKTTAVGVEYQNQNQKNFIGPLKGNSLQPPG
ncbi:hypothetical protein WMY93_025523 [Mugilogobius chulae]|uniref:Uncharacterized protein n=1 Tax=Mugilogobius chulae TaxID=88201 RepID=A0AAW0MUX7_9GOBI